MSARNSSGRSKRPAKPPEPAEQATPLANDEEPAIFHPQQRAFLAAFRETGNIRLACVAAKVGRSSHYRWLEEDPAYKAAYDLAKDDAIDKLETEARRRAIDGVEEPAGWYKGKAGGTVRRYSDVLLMFLLKGLRPEQYRERVDVSGGLISRIDFTKLPDEVILRITSGENVLAVLASLPGTAALLAGVSSPGQEIGSGAPPANASERITED